MNAEKVKQAAEQAFAEFYRKNPKQIPLDYSFREFDAGFTKGHALGVAEERARLIEIASSVEFQEVVRKKVEERLVKWRDTRISELRNNGLVIREKDGNESSVIRFGAETAWLIGVKALAEYEQATKGE